MGIRRTGRTGGARKSTRSSRVARPQTRRSSTSQRSGFVRQSRPTSTTSTPAAPAKKSVQRSITKPAPTTAQKATLKTPATQTPKTTTTTGSTPLQTQKKAPQQTTTAKTDKAPASTTPQTGAPDKKAPQKETPKAGGGLLGNALGAFGFGGQDKADNKPATDNTPKTDAPKKENKSLLGGLFGGAKDALVNTALDGMGLGDFKDIGLADRMSKLTPEQRGNLMDLAGSLKAQEGAGPKIDLKQHLGKLSTEEKGKLFDMAASGKLKELMGQLPQLQKAAEASKPTAQELQALQQISQMLGRNKLGGADGRFNFGDMNAVANGLMGDRGGLRQQVLGQLRGEGKNFQARVADRALRGRRGLFTRKAMQQINQQVPNEIKGQLSRGLQEAQTDPQTGRFMDNAPRNLTFNEMRQFEQNMNTLKGMQSRLGQVLGQQVVFPQGVSQEAINHTIQGALDPNADARNIDRVLKSIINNGRVELPLPPGGVLVPYNGR